jgi:hypothetical protein
LVKRQKKSNSREGSRASSIVYALSEIQPKTSQSVCPFPSVRFGQFSTEDTWKRPLDGEAEPITKTKTSMVAAVLSIRDLTETNNLQKEYADVSHI